MKKALIGAASALTAVLCGCRPDPDMVMKKQSAGAKNVTVQDNSRITVTRIGVFADDIAYNGRRGIYILTDANTGKEYIGVSGIGISDLGTHSVGKTGSRDER